MNMTLFSRQQLSACACPFNYCVVTQRNYATASQLPEINYCSTTLLGHEM